MQQTLFERVITGPSPMFGSGPPALLHCFPRSFKLAADDSVAIVCLLVLLSVIYSLITRHRWKLCRRARVRRYRRFGSLSRREPGCESSHQRREMSSDVLRFNLSATTCLPFLPGGQPKQRGVTSAAHTITLLVLWIRPL